MQNRIKFFLTYLLLVFCPLLLTAETACYDIFVKAMEADSDSFEVKEELYAQLDQCLAGLLKKTNSDQEKEEIYTELIQSKLFQVYMYASANKLIALRNAIQENHIVLPKYLAYINNETYRRAFFQTFKLYEVNYYYKRGVLSKTKSIAEEIIYDFEHVEEEPTNRDSLVVAKAYEFLGIVNHKLGAIQKAEGNYIKSLSYGDGTDGWGFKLLGDLYLGKDDVKAQSYYEKIERQLKKNLLQPKDSYYSIYNNRLSAIYLRMSEIRVRNKQLIKAIDYLKKAEIHDNLGSREYMNRIYFQYAQIYKERKNINQAEQYLDKTISFLRTQNKSKHYESVEAYIEKAKLYSTYNAQKALDTLDHATRILLVNSKFDFLKPKLNYSKLEAKITFLDLIQVRVKTLYQIALGTSSRDREVLKNLWSTAELGIQLIDSVKTQFLFEGEKELIIKNYRSIYEKLIWAGKELCDKEGQEYCQKSLLYADKTKSLRILESFRKRRLMELGDPEVNRLMRTIMLIESDLQLKSKELKSNSTLLELLSEKEATMKDFKSYNAGLFDLFFNTEYISIDKIQETLLSSDDVLVEFFEGEHYIFTFFMSTDTIFIHSFENSPENSFKDKIRVLQEILESPNANIAIPADFQKAALWIYNNLLSPLEKFSSKTNVIVIPDGSLANIPLEVLVTRAIAGQEINWRRLKEQYLINDYSFTYLYSLNILNEKKNQSQIKNRKKFASFASSYLDQPSLSVSRETAKRITETLDGNLYEELSKDEFLEMVIKYNAFLMVAHAEYEAGDPLKSKIVISDFRKGDTLYLYELYMHTLPVDFAFFMSCELNKGSRQEQTSGPFLGNFTHALNFTGIKSSVLSMWNAVDKTSSEIITSFFDNLVFEKMSKPKALQSAKLDYLARNDSDLALHPYLWAQFIQQGDPTHINLKNSKNNLFKIFIGLLGGLVVFFFFYKRIKLR